MFLFRNKTTLQHREETGSTEKRKTTKRKIVSKTKRNPPANYPDEEPEPRCWMKSWKSDRVKLKEDNKAATSGEVLRVLLAIDTEVGGAGEREVDHEGTSPTGVIGGPGRQGRLMLWQ